MSGRKKGVLKKNNNFVTALLVAPKVEKGFRSVNILQIIPQKFYTQLYAGKSATVCRLVHKSPQVWYKRG